MTEIAGITLRDPRARLMAATPADENMFFGFHDLSPWDATGRELVALRLDPQCTDMAHTAQPAQVCLWNPASGAIHAVAQTTCWNYQQAARQQWLPEGTGRLSFNRAGPSGKCEGVILDPLTGSERVVARGIHCIAPDGSWALAPDYAALARLWPAYGYVSLSAKERSAEDTGLWRVDLVSGRAHIFVSLAQVLEDWDGGSEGHFLTHPSISPDGQSVAFLHRFFPADGGSFTRLLVADADGANLRVLADEKVSHFDWLDNGQLLVWARFTGGGLAQMRAAGTLNTPLIRPLLGLARRFTGRWKKRMLSESYFVLATYGAGGREKFGWPSLDEDGHPMVARSHDWIVTDTYPDRDGVLTLILYHRGSGRRVDVARFADGVATGDSDAKCDLHPRWNRDETAIAVDWCDRGRRRVVLIDVSQIVTGDA